jgi:pyroglutamyl-peptidase
VSPTVLVTGFEAFGGHAHNPTERLVAELERDRLPGVRVRGAVLPVSYSRALQVLLAEVDRLRPAAVVCCGLDARAGAIAIERVGLNVKDRGDAGGRPDNDGATPRDEPVVPGGPDGLFTTLPNRAILDALGSCGIPAALSGSAGTFVCNAVLYGLLHHLRPGPGGGRQVVAGFLHFPRTPELEVAEPAVPPTEFDVLRRGLEVALETVAARLTRAAG